MREPGKTGSTATVVNPFNYPALKGLGEPQGLRAGCDFENKVKSRIGNAPGPSSSGYDLTVVYASTAVKAAFRVESWAFWFCRRGCPGSKRSLEGGEESFVKSEIDFHSAFGRIRETQASMEFSKIIPLSKLHEETKIDSDQSFPNDVELLQDAFSHGAFHNEKFRFGLLASRLSDVELASLFLPVAHGLVRGNSQDDSDRIEEVVRLYRALSDWQNGQLGDKQELKDALAAVRSCVSRLDPGWKTSAIPFFRILEVGVNERLGTDQRELSEIEKEYSNT
jgi:hypothetical protein